MVIFEPTLVGSGDSDGLALGTDCVTEPLYLSVVVSLAHRAPAKGGCWQKTALRDTSRLAYCGLIRDMTVG